MTTGRNGADRVADWLESTGCLHRVTREYEPFPITPPTPGLIIGRLKGLSVSVEGGSATPLDYDVDYYYETTGRMSRITGPGLPAYGAVYNYLSRSDLLQRIDFKTSSSSTVATTTRSFESARDLLTSVENKWGSTSVSKYAYRNDDLARRKDVIDTGTAFSGKQDVWTYNARNELDLSKRYNNTTPDSTAKPGSAVRSRL
jgi:hypothetical protein